MHWILAHLIGDFLIQSDYLALNKKRSSWICALHVITYMIPFLWCDLTYQQLLAIAIQHYIIDRTDVVVWFMHAKGSTQFALGPCSPWSIIVIDNILHILWIAWIASLV